MIDAAGLQERAFSEIAKRSGRLLGSTAARLVQLDEQRLLDEARRRTRLDDFGDPSFREPFGLLLRSLETEAKLSFLGRVAARQDILRLLSHRLRMLADRRRHPEIAAQEIHAPLFVTGLPRTGTTLLHGLLAQDPANRAALNWEMMFPSPPPARARHQRDRRIELAERQIRWFRRLAPDFQKIHPVGARLPEECLIIQSHSFVSFQFQTAYDVPSYQAWVEAQDLRACYEMHRQFLQHLQWHGPKGSWVLKAPAHLFGLRALFAAYPDAGVVLMHRDPVEVVASVASLHTALRSTFSDAVDPVAVGDEVSRRWADGIARAFRDRDGGCAPADLFVDVLYADLIRDPLATVRRIYRHFGRRLGPAAEDRMRAFLAANPRDKHGRHRYALTHFGLDPDQVRARYRGYCERFGF